MNTYLECICVSKEFLDINSHESYRADKCPGTISMPSFLTFVSLLNYG